MGKNNNTLARAYACIIPGRPFRSPPAGWPRPHGFAAPQPEAAPVENGAQPQRAEGDSLMIAVRRSLEACRDTAQLRTLLAMEGGQPKR